MELFAVVFWWLSYRLTIVNRFLDRTLGLPGWVSIVISTLVVLLFVYCLYDIYRQRHKGKWSLFWILIISLVPLSTFLYLAIGRRQLHNAPYYIKPSAEDMAQGPKPRGRYFLGTTTALGGIISLIAVIAGCAALVFFIVLVIAYLQCINDPKCI